VNVRHPIPAVDGGMIARLADRVRKQVGVHVVAANHPVVEVEPVCFCRVAQAKRATKKRVANKRLNIKIGLAGLLTKTREQDRECVCGGGWGGSGSITHSRGSCAHCTWAVEDHVAANLSQTRLSMKVCRRLLLVDAHFSEKVVQDPGASWLLASTCVRTYSQSSTRRQPCIRIRVMKVRSCVRNQRAGRRHGSELPLIEVRRAFWRGEKHRFIEPWCGEKRRYIEP
jgi:hypothetical protein